MQRPPIETKESDRTVDRRASPKARALRAAVLIAAAIAASCSGPVQRTRGERTCDRNGDYEERTACSP
jgi:uncharacterized membrane protein YidH (DUF202 family)